MLYRKFSFQPNDLFYVWAFRQSWFRAKVNERCRCQYPGISPRLSVTDTVDSLIPASSLSLSRADHGPRVILCQLSCGYFCCEMCFTVSPIVYILKMVISCQQQDVTTCDFSLSSVSDKSDTSNRVCVCLLSDTLYLAHGHAGKFSVHIRYNLKHIQLPAFQDAFACR